MSGYYFLAVVGVWFWVPVVINRALARRARPGTRWDLTAWVRMRSLIATVPLVFLLLGLTGCERYALDRQMAELCKKDGGVKVYETVTVSASEFGPEGRPFDRYVLTAKSPADQYGPDYRFVQERQILVGRGANTERGEGRLARWYAAIYRRSDGRLLGESVSYERSGGDGFTFGFKPSGNACPLPRVDVATSVFLKGE